MSLDDLIRELLGASLEPDALEHTVRNQIDYVLAQLVRAEADRIVQQWPGLRELIAERVREAVDRAVQERTVLRKCAG